MSQMPPKVLIADDSRPIHQMIQRALPAEYAPRTVHAYNGEKCLVALDRGIDLAFIDIRMPAMGGLDALWATRIAGNKTFVTLISGAATKRCADLARRLDVYEFLIKPFDGNDIEGILRSYQQISTLLNVLLVDDSPVLLKVMRNVLTKSAFRLEIDVANSGRDAIACCQKTAFDVVFLDVNMPEIDGHETLAKLLRERPQTKVVMISSEHNPSRERTAMTLGAAAVMHKPFFPTEIDAVLHRIFGMLSPKLAIDGRIRDFEIKIHGRTVAVEHGESGHVYEYIWFRDPPYLRLPQIKRNGSAEIAPGALARYAKKAAMLELENASLLKGLAH